MKRVRWLALTAWCGLAVAASGQVTRTGTAVAGRDAAGDPDAQPPNDDSGPPLTLCECEVASGSPNGLACSKEGWFISNFEYQGTWMGGGGLVPLSRAICCRPCLPGELPKVPGLKDPSAKPVAVVTIGCHASSGRQYRALQCEQTGSSYVTGFLQAERVNSYYYDEYYPVGQVECCTPAVLLSTGEVWQLTRCDCTLSHTKDCGGEQTNRLLWGFAQWRMTSGGEYIPVAPLECCGLCLGDKIHDSTDCKDLSYCHKNGICTLGACECFEGYAGSDCSVSTSGGDDGSGMPWWTTVLIVAGSVIFLLASSIVMRYIVHTIRGHGSGGANGSGAAGDASQPLLLGDEGSAGSHDTDDELDDADCEIAACHHPVGLPVLHTGVSPAHSSLSTSEAMFQMDDLAGQSPPMAPETISEQPEEEQAEVLAEAQERGLALVLPAPVTVVIPGGADAPDASALASPIARSVSLPLLQPSARGSDGCGSSGTGVGIATAADYAGGQQHHHPPALPEADLGTESQQEDEEEWEALPRRTSSLPDDRSEAPYDSPPPYSSLQHGSMYAPAPGPSGRTTAVYQQHHQQQHQQSHHGMQHDAESDYGAELKGVSEQSSVVGAGDNAAVVSLSSAICAICMEKPIQVALVPCGHANVCRRCSRRLQRCPFCRKEIVRRQRLFYSS